MTGAMSSAVYQQEKPKVVPIIHERPKMPAKTWSALRSHILSERKKKREDESKQKEFERLKKERESKKKQASNNLEETKDQITSLEEKLSSLKEEKHQLFLTLKKVLNEDDVRRRKESSEMASMYGHPQPHSNVLPMSGHVAGSAGPSSRYMQPQASQQRPAMFQRGHQPSPGLVKRPHRSPSPPRGPVPSASSRAVASVYGLPAYTSSSARHGYLPPSLSTQANIGPRDLLKEAVSQGIGLASLPPGAGAGQRELMANLGHQNRDILQGMAAADREMFAKGLAGLAGVSEMPSALNLAGAAASSQSETYARYLATFQQQLDAGNKTAMAAAALSELDRARGLVQGAPPPHSAPSSRPGYYSHDLTSRPFPSSRQ